MLALIQANPDVTARQLARGLAVTPPNIAVWIERLLSRGLVLRSRSETDARLQHIRVTAAGAKLMREATKRLLEGEAAALATLTGAKRAMLDAWPNWYPTTPCKPPSVRRVCGVRSSAAMSAGRRGM